jgi:hypothetical protein
VSFRRLHLWLLFIGKAIGLLDGFDCFSLAATHH